MSDLTAEMALGLVLSLLESRTSGRGQVVDTAMVEGAGLLMSMIHGLGANGRWPAPRAGNIPALFGRLDL